MTAMITDMIRTYKYRLCLFQHPYLFIGSLRTNLDPYNEYTDSEIWIALEQVRQIVISSMLTSGEYLCVLLCHNIIRRN